jgi:hypothetical protein
LCSTLCWLFGGWVSVPLLPFDLTSFGVLTVNGSACYIELDSIGEDFIAAGQIIILQYFLRLLSGFLLSSYMKFIENIGFMSRKNQKLFSFRTFL